MNLLLILILPFFIAILPFTGLVVFCRLPIVTKTKSRIVVISMFAITLSFFATIWATTLSIYGMTRNQPQGKAGCVTGASLFLILGFTLTFACILYSIVTIYSNRKKS